ncbi:MAG TPA: hypothetical protein VGR57_08410, partial [Ktedonobacterales bacterium]|nr:hypothetical protein [Ktedonobacterales bacterium]
LRPGARLEILPNTTGGVAEDQAAALAEILTQWLATPAQRRPPFSLLAPEEESAPVSSGVGAGGKTRAGSRRVAQPAAEPAHDMASAEAAGAETDVRLTLDPADDEPAPPAGTTTHPAGESEEPHANPED